MKTPGLAKRFVVMVLVAGALGISRRADAVTIEDIIGLTHAGLSDEVLVALVETDGTVFTLTPNQLVQLKDAGVSERVIVTMLWQGRTPIPEQSSAAQAAIAPELVQPELRMDPNPPAPAPSHETTVVVVPTIVPWPFFVQVSSRPIPSAQRPPVIEALPGFGRFTNSFGRFLNDGFPR